MEKSLQELLGKYQRHLSQAESNLSRLEMLKLNDTEQFRTQDLLRKVWKHVLKDLTRLSDKTFDDYSKKSR